ncbi:MAG: threonyl-tRNA synthetase [Frankiaceae bacterium]|nr:threonyl-tRNA synthetase [Frankiaceae bacterium]
MADIRLTLDGSPLVAPEGTKAGGALKEAGVKAIAVRDNRGDLHDLSWTVEDGAVLSSIPMASDEGREVLRHSAAHVMAQAVTALFPDAKFAIGPPVQDGFYYDFDVERPFTPEDVERIEAKMREIVAANQRFHRRVVSREEAEALFRDQPYKLEIIERAAAGTVEGEETVDAAGPEITVYDNDGGFVDLCRGPHLPNTKAIPAFRLMRTAAAYWRGDEKNKQLQRIYGTAWESKDALAEHLNRLEEAEKRDHRRLGADLDLFSFPEEIGSGLAVFHPKGGIIRRVMEDYSRKRHEEAGYDFVSTPHISKGTLFETSGHLPWYAESMFPPMDVEGTKYYLKPMNCPFHILIYRSRGRSYRELPLRLFEFGAVYRYEKSGVVHGLTRVRGLTMDDAHIFCAKEQMAGELKNLLGFVLDLLRDYGLTDFYLELSTRDDSPKFVGEPAEWEEATEALREAAVESGLELVPDPGGAAFYGPKISVQARDAIGRTWQMSTIQVDFQMPQRFGMEYQSSANTRDRPVMIHRALFGSVERFFGVLTEHYAGAFPPWLSPVQALGIPIAERHEVYLDGVVAKLRAAGLRAEVDASDERMQNKIRRAQEQKVPFMLVAGDRDVEAGAVSFRYRNGDERRGVPVDEAVAEIAAVVEQRLVDPAALRPAE